MSQLEFSLYLVLFLILVPVFGGLLKRVADMLISSSVAGVFF